MESDRAGIPARLDERGVALPLALFGLVAVSLLVTAALVTSSTEVALSRAHQDGTRSLYAADGALEQFVAQRAAMVADPDQRLVGGDFTATLVNGQHYMVFIAELARGPNQDLPGGGLQRRETYSLLAQPQNGRGRGVGALIEATRMASPVSLNIDSGLTLGAGADIRGAATISDGSDSEVCTEGAAPAAIRYSSDATVTIEGAARDRLVGDTIQDTRSAADLMLHVLDDNSLADLSAMANIRFGPMFDARTFPNGAGPTHTAAAADLRWGCPPHMVAGCPAEHAAYFPTVVIDAAGEEVRISNYHGQGTLVVRNGSLHITGSFKYAGIILVEGTLRVTGGGGGNTPNIEGGVIAMGDESVIDPGDDNELTGSSVIRFNLCQIMEAQRGLTAGSLETAPQTIDAPTFAWFEVVR
jgi:hypothetical protein